MLSYSQVWFGHQAAKAACTFGGISTRQPACGHNQCPHMMLQIPKH
jgi:hypothetical protein